MEATTSILCTEDDGYISGKTAHKIIETRRKNNKCGKYLDVIVTRIKRP